MEYLSKSLFLYRTKLNFVRRETQDFVPKTQDIGPFSMFLYVPVTWGRGSDRTLTSLKKT